MPIANDVCFQWTREKFFPSILSWLGHIDWPQFFLFCWPPLEAFIYLLRIKHISVNRPTPGRSTCISARGCTLILGLRCKHFPYSRGYPITPVKSWATEGPMQINISCYNSFLLNRYLLKYHLFVKNIRIEFLTQDNDVVTTVKWH